jgi:hypothetical protein
MKNGEQAMKTKYKKGLTTVIPAKAGIQENIVNFNK